MFTFSAVYELNKTKIASYSSYDIKKHGIRFNEIKKIIVLIWLQLFSSRLNVKSNNLLQYIIRLENISLRKFERTIISW